MAGCVRRSECQTGTVYDFENRTIRFIHFRNNFRGSAGFPVDADGSREHAGSAWRGQRNPG